MEADLESINKWKNGDLRGFDTIYNKYQNIAMRTAFLICRNFDDSEDIVQETFVKCHLHIHKLKDANSFQAWMLKILVHNAYSLLKKKGKEMADDQVEKQINSISNNCQPSPLQLELKKEQSHTVLSAIDTLSDKHKIVVILYYYDELSVKEIARVLGCREGTVKSRLYIARNQLKNLLREEDLYAQGWI